MKNPKKLSLKTLEINRNLADYFKKSYSAKMGGTQQVKFPSGEVFEYDDREYYKGRGGKYNATIKHDDIVTQVTIQDLKQYVERKNLQRLAIIENNKKEKAYKVRVEQAKKQGVYSMDGCFVELSDKERYSNSFDAKRLANTLKIKVEDAELLKSKGKTYVFAKSEDGNTYELYHPDLSCNYLSINVSIATPERIAEFKPKEWQNAPYAHLVGQTSNKNHFVC